MKELQSLNVETTHVIYNIITRGNDPDIIMEELNSILGETRVVLMIDQGICSSLIPSVPPFALRSNVPKMDGQNSANFNDLPWEVQNNHRAFHIECESGSSSNLKKMITAAKDLIILEKWWGPHVCISETLTMKASPGEVKNMTKVAQHHTNYQASITLDTLLGITNLEATATRSEEHTSELQSRSMKR